MPSPRRQLENELELPSASSNSDASNFLNKIGDEAVPITSKIDSFRLAGAPVVKKAPEKFTKKYVRALTLKQVA